MSSETQTKKMPPKKPPPPARAMTLQSQSSNSKPPRPPPPSECQCRNLKQCKKWESSSYLKDKLYDYHFSIRYDNYSTILRILELELIVPFIDLWKMIYSMHERSSNKRKKIWSFKRKMPSSLNAYRFPKRLMSSQLIDCI